MRLLFLHMVVFGFVASCAEPQANYDKTAYRTTKSISYSAKLEFNRFIDEH